MRVFSLSIISQTADALMVMYEKFRFESLSESSPMRSHEPANWSIFTRVPECSPPNTQVGRWHWYCDYLEYHYTGIETFYGGDDEDKHMNRKAFYAMMSAIDKFRSSELKRVIDESPCVRLGVRPALKTGYDVDYSKRSFETDARLKLHVLSTADGDEAQQAASKEMLRVYGRYEYRLRYHDPATWNTFRRASCDPTHPGVTKWQWYQDYLEYHFNCIKAFYGDILVKDGAHMNKRMYDSIVVIIDAEYEKELQLEIEEELSQKK